MYFAVEKKIKSKLKNKLTKVTYAEEEMNLSF
jgi:hypothetical protein